MDCAHYFAELTTTGVECWRSGDAGLTMHRARPGGAAIVAGSAFDEAGGLTHRRPFELLSFDTIGVSRSGRYVPEAWSIAVAAGGARSCSAIGRSQPCPCDRGRVDRRLRDWRRADGRRGSRERALDDHAIRFRVGRHHELKTPIATIRAAAEPWRRID